MQLLSKAEQIRAEYAQDENGRITSLGKFEGEPIFAPYYWELGLDGCADFDDGREYRFKFSAGSEDFKMWPELKEWLGRKRTLSLTEDSVGFVHCS